MGVCKNCSKFIKDDALVCPNCGFENSKVWKKEKCPNCQGEILSSYNFCKYCGYDLCNSKVEVKHEN